MLTNNVTHAKSRDLCTDVHSFCGTDVRLFKRLHDECHLACRHFYGGYVIYRHIY